jgi:hypothetical protein
LLKKNKEAIMEKVKFIGVEISEDGETYWRNNNGIIQRKAMYANNPAWEVVATTSLTPTTAEELKKYCENGGYGYSRNIWRE